MARWILPVVVGLLFGAVALWYADHVISREAESYREAANANARSRAQQVVREEQQYADSLGRLFQQIDDLKTAQEQVLRRLRNAEHLAAARRLGVGTPGDSAAVARLAASGDLHHLVDTPHYYVQDLDVSVPYVTHDLARAMDELGRRFHDSLSVRGLPPFRYNVSSVLRTREGQQALRYINPNAARGASAHEYGTTIDVVFHTYDLSPAYETASSGDEWADIAGTVRKLLVNGLGMLYWQELQGELGRILIAMQHEGKLLVTLEREQPVFHITIARRYDRSTS